MLPFSQLLAVKKYTILGTAETDFHPFLFLLHCCLESTPMFLYNWQFHGISVMKLNAQYKLQKSTFTLENLELF